jgi:mannose-6-phosphate isomerase-like protein (cupin superfamily)
MTDLLNGFAIDPGSGVERDDRALKASRDTTGGALSVFELIVEGGPSLHVHEREHESFYVLEGELAVRCGEDTFRAPAGSFVFLPIGRPHRFWSTGGSARVLLIAVPAGIEAYFHEMAQAANDEARRGIARKYGIRHLEGALAVQQEGD